MLALGGIAWFVYRRVVDAFEPSERMRRVMIGAMAGGLGSLIASRALGELLPNIITRVFGTIGAFIMLAVIVAFAVLVVERVLAAPWDIASWWRARGEPDKLVESPPEKPERRDFVAKAAAGTALALGGGTSGYGAFYGRHDYQIEEVPIGLSNMPPALDGYTIVQLSDIHLGPLVGEGELRSMYELVSRAKPDLIVLTGDLVDNNDRYMDRLGRMTRALMDRAPVLACAGNHDYYAGIDQTLVTLRKAGAHALVNEARLVGDGGGDIAIVGVDEIWASRFGKHRGPNIHKAVAKLPGREVPRVLLCHQPVYFAKSAEHVDLQLSGHTHGGQFNPGVRPANLVLPYGWVAGHYRRDGAHLWVNRGFGTVGPPARLGAAPEITKIVLTV